MKRSGDVTASAIILFFGSGLLLLLGAFGFLGAMLASVPPELRGLQFFRLLFYAVLATWGIATGIGVLQLRPWARISMIVTSSLAICGCISGAFGLMLIPTILKQVPGAPPAFASVMVVAGAMILVIPLAIAIWWLVLFTRQRVALEFAARGATPVSPDAFSSADSRIAISTAFSPQISAAPSAPRIPLSILIIAGFFLVSAGFVLMGLPFTIRMHVPAIVFGMVVHGSAGWIHLAVLVAAQAGLSIAVLRKRAWALDGLIAVAVFSLANAALFEVSPNRKAVFDAMFANMFSKWPAPPGMNLSDLTDSIERIMPISMAFGFLLSVVILFFLLARRRAFRAACNSQSSAPPTP